KSGGAKKHVLRRFHQSSNHPLLARVSLDLVMHGGIEPRSFSQRLGASGRSRSTVKYRRRHHFLKDGSRGTTAFARFQTGRAQTRQVTARIHPDAAAIRTKWI